MALIAVNGLTGPLPVEIPIVVMELLQLYTVFGTLEPVGVTNKVNTPLHRISELAVNELTLGVGFTVSVNDCGVPLHALDIGVTVMNPVIGTLLTRFVAVKAPMVVAPERPMPILLFVLVQL